MKSPRPRCWPTRPLLPLLALAAAACVDDSPSAVAPTVPLGPGEAIAALECSVTVASGELSCADAPQADARLSILPGGGPAQQKRFIGGQHWYLRLSSQNLAWSEGLFEMDVMVQNLSNLAMATADGATPDASGIQVFFHEGPTAQGGGSVTVANPSGLATFTGADQPFFQFGGTVAGVPQDGLDGGILAPGATSQLRHWEFQLDGPVTSFSFLVYVRTETPPGALATIAPQVTGISPGTLVPGQTATLTGINFNPDPTANYVNIGGTVARGTTGSTTSLSFVVPCMPSSSSTLRVYHSGMYGPGGAPVAATVQAPGRTLAKGEAAVLGTAELPCWELGATGVNSRYLVSVYNTSTLVTKALSFDLSGNMTGSEAADVPAAPFGARVPLSAGDPFTSAAERRSDEWHARMLERNGEQYSRLRTRFARDPRMRPRMSVGVAADVVEPPLTRTLRVPNAAVSNFCTSYYPVTATRVYYGGKVAIYEDDDTPAGFKAANNAAMQDYYTRIGDQFNAGMEPIIRNNFGDPLARDAQTDNNGVLVALFTPVINNHFPGLAGFVASCDLFPNDEGSGDANTSSNFGEVFYAYQPTVAGTGYASFTADQWYRTIRSTFIHETKHVASFVARTLNGAPQLEQSWLEEGTARHAEELWARQTVYDLPWKGNHGYGSADDPFGLYCDARPTDCSHPLAPAVNMQRHFVGVYPYMSKPGERSPFGATPLDASTTWYAASWSLVRYAIDRYGASDAAFLTGLNQATTRGTANLTARAGVSLEVLMGGWVSALAADDYPGLTAPGPDARMPTWNLREIYTGLHADYPASISAAYPVVGTPFALGDFSAPEVSVIYGGATVWYDLSGAHTRPQFLRLGGGSGSTTPDPSLRIAIVRVE
jgi:hypothetical protein